MGETIPKAFVLKLKPGALEQHVHWHDNIWPDLQREIGRQGIAEISLFHIDDTVFLHSRVADAEASTRLRDSEVHHRWGDLIAPLMHDRDDAIVESREPREIWHFVPDAAG